MKKSEAGEIDFSEVLCCLWNEGLIERYSDLVDFATNSLIEGNVELTYHVLDTLVSSEEMDYFRYDYSMGTLEVPTKIECVEDVEDLLD